MHDRCESQEQPTEQGDDGVEDDVDDETSNFERRHLHDDGLAIVVY